MDSNWACLILEALLLGLPKAASKEQTFLSLSISFSG